MTMPKRKPSFTVAQIDHDSASTLFSLEELQLDNMGDCKSRIDSSLYLSADELISCSEFTLDFRDEAEEDGKKEAPERGVRFAPYPTIIAVMGLDDYTPKELEACWYSHRDVHSFRRHEYISNHQNAKAQDRRWGAA